MRSLFSSSVTARTRFPRMPTHDPTGSIRGSVLITEIFVRLPASRATFMIFTTPSRISDTSRSNRRRTKSGCVRETIKLGPLEATSIFISTALIKSPTIYCSPGIFSFTGRTPWAFWKSIMIFPPSNCLTLPEIIWFMLEANSSETIIFSAFLNCCMIAWRAVCAAIRPKLRGVTSHSIMSPTLTSGNFSTALE